MSADMNANKQVTNSNSKPTPRQARQIPSEELEDLFELETLSPHGEVNGSCVVILCWTKRIDDSKD